MSSSLISPAPGDVGYVDFLDLCLEVRVIRTYVTLDGTARVWVHVIDPKHTPGWDMNIKVSELRRKK